MKNEFESQAGTKGWEFNYGRRDFQNLIQDAELGKTYLFLDPVKRKNLKGDSGGVYGRRFRGHFMLLRKSKLDQEYSGNGEAKYEKHIKPLEAELDGLESSLLGCAMEYEIDWESQEIINVFDENMDGLLVTYTITQTL